MKTRKSNPFRSQCSIAPPISATLLSPFAALAIGFLLTAEAQAKVITWDGGYPTTGIWNNARNWAGDVAFANGDDVVVGPACKANYIGTARTVKSLTYLNTCNASFNTSFNDKGSAGTGTFFAFTFNASNTGITIQAGDAYAHTLGNTANGAAANVVLAGDLTITHNGTKTYTIARPIIGAFSLIKDGPGPLTIVGDSTYSGGTFIINGSIQGTTNDTMLGTGDVTMGGTGSNGATFTTGRSPANNFTINAPDSGTITVGNNATTSAPVYSGAFTLNGDLTLQTQAAATTGALTLTGGVSGTGNLTLNNQSGSSAITLSGSDVNPAGNLTAQGDGTGGTTINSTIGANVTGLTKTGSSTLALSGANAYSGPTVVSGGTLEMGASNVLPGTALTLSNATLNAATFTDTVGTLDVTDNAVIHFETGAALAFADSHLSDWSDGTLDLTGALIPGFSLRFGTNSNGLTPAQLAVISASGFSSFGLDANGYLTAINNNPPMLAGSDIVDDKSGGPVGVGTLVTYSVTFNKNMNESTVEPADFGNAGTANVTIGTVTETTPGVFLVQVTPDNGGTLQLQVNAGAVLKDTMGNNLDTASAIVDDTTLFVDTTPPTLAGSDIADDKGGGPVSTGNLVTYTVTFSEDMDAATVEIADFGNAGTATVTIGTIIEISPGIFTVEATATSTGTLRLQVNAGASLKDGFGNPLDTASAVADDTTLTVLDLYAYWDTNGAAAGAGGPFPDGTWDAANTLWNVASNGIGTTYPWGSGQTAVFAAGTDTADLYYVTVDGTREIGGLTFEEGTALISGGTALRLSKNATADVAAGLSATVATPITEDASPRSLTKDGPGTLTLGKTSSYSGGTTITGGTLELGDGVSPNVTVAGTITNNAALVIANPANQTFGGAISGSGTLTKNNPAMLTLTGTNSYTGTTIVNGGTLAFSNPAALATTSAITLAGGTTLRSNLVGATINAPITLGESGTTATITAPSIPGAGGTSAVPITLNGVIDGAGNLTFSGIENNNAYGTVILNAASTYEGTTLVTCTGGTNTQIFVRLGTDNALPGTTVLTLDGGNGAGTGRWCDLNLNGHNQTLAGLTNVTGRTLRTQRVNNTSGTPATLTINGSDSSTFSGQLGGGGGNFGLTMSGSGTFTVTGARSYSGDTTVTAGTLSLGSGNANNDLSTVTVASGAKLELTYAGTDIVTALVINGIPQTGGSYGHTDSGADNGGQGIGFFDAYFAAGTGTLTLPEAFAAWITGTFAKGTVPLDQQGPNDDYDNDGISNLAEYAIAGQDPTVSHPAIGSFSGNTLSFTKRAGTSSLTYAIQKSTDLGVSDVWEEVTGGSYVNNATTISYTLTPGTPASNFIRLQVVSN